MSTAPVIRPAVAADVPAISSLEQAVYGVVVYPGFFFRQAMDLWSGLLRVAEVPSGELAGYVLAAPSLRPGEAWILSAAVREEHRGRGIARELAEAALAELRRLGFRSVHLTVHPDNRAAVRLYERLGFSARASEPEYFGPGEPRLLMELPLDS